MNTFVILNHDVTSLRKTENSNPDMLVKKLLKEYQENINLLRIRRRNKKREKIGSSLTVKNKKGGGLPVCSRVGAGKVGRGPKFRH